MLQFRFKPEISGRELVTPDCSKICPNMPFQKPVQKSLSQHKIIRKLRIYEEKGLLMQYHSINIEKLQKRMKNKFSNIAYQIRWSVGNDFKIIISTKSNAVESNHSDDSDIRRIYFTSLEKHFSAKVY